MSSKIKDRLEDRRRLRPQVTSKKREAGPDLDTSPRQRGREGQALIVIGSLAQISIPLTSPGIAQPICFTRVDRYLIEEHGEAAAMGDLNGDRAPDIAIAGFDRINLFFNDGTGAFPVHRQITDGVDLPKGLAIADFNGDQILDLLVANRVGTQASVFFNDGSGQFSSPRSIDVGIGQELVTAGDLDGDLDTDVVFGAGNPRAGDLVVLLNDGDGSFSAGTFYGAVDDEYMDVAIGDLDRDSDLDIVAVSGNYSCTLGQGVVATLRNRGDGTFETARRYSYDLTGLHSVAISDLNDDQAPDVIAAATCDYVYVFPNRGDGTLGLATAFEFASDTRSRDLVVGDLDADRDVDIAVAAGGYVLQSEFNGVSILHNRGNGFLGDRVLYPLDVSTSIVAGDLDGDNDDDLAIGTAKYYLSYENALSVTLNSCGDDRGPTLVVQGACPGPIDLVVTNATPNAFVDFAFSFEIGSASVPLGPCRGVVLSLGDPLRYAGSRRADAAGAAVLSGVAPPVACGASYLQVVDRDTCRVSNRAAL